MLCFCVPLHHDAHCSVSPPSCLLCIRNCPRRARGPCARVLLFYRYFCLHFSPCVVVLLSYGPVFLYLYFPLLHIRCSVTLFNSCTWSCAIFSWAAGVKSLALCRDRLLPVHRFCAHFSKAPHPARISLIWGERVLWLTPYCQGPVSPSTIS